MDPGDADTEAVVVGVVAEMTLELDIDSVPTIEVEVLVLGGEEEEEEVGKTGATAELVVELKGKPGVEVKGSAEELGVALGGTTEEIGVEVKGSAEELGVELGGTTEEPGVELGGPGEGVDDRGIGVEVGWTDVVVLLCGVVAFP